MRAKHSRLLRRSAAVLLFGIVAVFPDYVGAADRLTGLHSAHDRLLHRRDRATLILVRSGVNPLIKNPYNHI